MRYSKKNLYNNILKRKKSQKIKAYRQNGGNTHATHALLDSTKTMTEKVGSLLTQVQSLGNDVSHSSEQVGGDEVSQNPSETKTLSPERLPELSKAPSSCSWLARLTGCKTSTEQEAEKKLHNCINICKESNKELDKNASMNAGGKYKKSRKKNKKNLRKGGGPSLKECFDEHIGNHIKAVTGYLKKTTDDSVTETTDSINRIKHSIKNSGHSFSSHIHDDLTNIGDTAHKLNNTIKKASDQLESATIGGNRRKIKSKKKSKK